MLGDGQHYFLTRSPSNLRYLVAVTSGELAESCSAAFFLLSQITTHTHTQKVFAFFHKSKTNTNQTHRFDNADNSILLLSYKRCYCFYTPSVSAPNHSFLDPPSFSKTPAPDTELLLNMSNWRQPRLSKYSTLMESVRGRAPYFLNSDFIYSWKPGWSFVILKNCLYRLSTCSCILLYLGILIVSGTMQV